jgi:hypothetical protein
MPPNNSMQRPPLRAAADAERSACQGKRQYYYLWNHSKEGRQWRDIDWQFLYRC